MLANAILIPVYAHPISWGVAFLLMGVEIVVAQVMLRKFGLEAQHLGRSLLAMNVCTWLPFLIAVDAMNLRLCAAHTLPFAGLEVLVALVETVLILMLSRGWFSSSRTAWRPLSLGQAFCVSLAANVASVMGSVAVVLMFAR